MQAKGYKQMKLKRGPEITSTVMSKIIKYGGRLCACPTGSATKGCNRRSKLHSQGVELSPLLFEVQVNDY